MTTVYVLEANLRNSLGHFLNNTTGLAKALSAANCPTKIFANVDAADEAVRELEAKRLFRNTSMSGDPENPNDLIAAMESLGEQFFEDFCKLGNIPENAVLFVPTTAESQIYGMACFLNQRQVPATVKVIFNFHWETVSESDARAAAFKRAFAHLRMALAPSQILLSAHTPGVAAAMETVTGGLPVEVLPMPQYYGEQKPAAPAGNTRKPILTVLGRSLPRKGSGAILDLVYKLRSRCPSLRFKIQSTSTKGLAKWKARFTPRVTLFSGGLSMRQYLANLNTADIFLLPYSTEDYADRTSGVFAECAAMGRVAIVPANTWLARQIEAGRAAGVVFDSTQADAIENAVIRAVQEIDTLKEKAYKTADYWWENVSAAAYVRELRKRCILTESSEHQSKTIKFDNPIITHPLGENA